MERTDISIIIPASDATALLPVSIAHLDVQSYPSGRFEIVVAAFGKAANQAGQVYRYMQGLPIRSTCVPTDSPNPCEALNAAVERSRGTWVLFLDEDLIAGSHLVENHVTAQERRGGNTAVVGSIDIHPQASPEMLTKWGFGWALDNKSQNQPVNALKWRAHNLSLPRRLFLDAGGFDTGYAHGGLYDIDLAWRLARTGVQGYLQRNAAAYALRGLDFAAEQRRRYWEGRSLSRLVEFTGSDDVEKHFLDGMTRGQYTSREARVRLGHLIANHVALHSPIGRRLIPWLLEQRFAEGYFDARHGIAPRNLAQGTSEPVPDVLNSMQITP